MTYGGAGAWVRFDSELRAVPYYHETKQSTRQNVRLEVRVFISVFDTSNDTRTSFAAAPLQSWSLTVIAAGVVLGILYWARSIFITATVSTILAIILEPFVAGMVRVRIPRPISSALVLTVAGLAIYFAGAAAYNQASSLASDVPQFRDHISEIAVTVGERVQHIQEATTKLIPAKKDTAAPSAANSARKARGKQTTPAPIQEVRIHQDSNPVADFVFAKLGSVYEFILMSSFVPFLVFFMLSWRDHFYKSFLRFFDGPDRVAAARSLDSISAVARAFVVGNFLIGLASAILSAVVFAVIHVPFPFLAGVLSGFLTIIPYIGVPLALLPPLLTAIAEGQGTSALLLIMTAVMVLHVIALNGLYPKLVGARVHLNPLVVTLSFMFWGFLWDASGLVLAIPLTAGLKAVCDNVVPLRPIGRFLGD